MRHAREDYNRIQDPTGLIPEDEPVFILRAQDKYAARTVDYYADNVEFNNGDPNIVAACRNMSAWMRDWKTHKEPDMPKDKIVN